PVIGPPPSDVQAALVSSHVELLSELQGNLQYLRDLSRGYLHFPHGNARALLVRFKLQESRIIDKVRALEHFRMPTARKWWRTKCFRNLPRPRLIDLPDLHCPGRKPNRKTLAAG